MDMDQATGLGQLAVQGRTNYRGIVPAGCSVQGSAVQRMNRAKNRELVVLDSSGLGVVVFTDQKRGSSKKTATGGSSVSVQRMLRQG